MNSLILSTLIKAINSFIRFIKLIIIKNIHREPVATEFPVNHIILKYQFGFNLEQLCKDYERKD